MKSRAGRCPLSYFRGECLAACQKAGLESLSIEHGDHLGHQDSGDRDGLKVTAVLDMVVHTFSPRAGEAEVPGLLGDT